MRFKLIGLVIFCIFCVFALANTANAVGEPPQPKLIDSPEIKIDKTSGGTGRGLLYLRNDTDNTIRVSLRAIVSPSSKLADAKLSFLGENEEGDGGAVRDFDMPAQGTTRVWAIVTQAWSPGEFEADLNNRDVRIGKIRIKAFPLSLTLDTANPDKTSLALVDGKATMIFLGNDDPVAYALNWKLSIDGQYLCGASVIIPPNAIGLLKCQPSRRWWHVPIREALRDDSKEGSLILSYSQPGAGVGDGLPLKTIPIKANYNHFSLGGRQTLSYIILMSFLILGGATSLGLRQLLPNRLQRLNIKEQLDTLARTTADLGSHVDSKLQILLRVERRRLNDLLRSRRAFSPDFANIAGQCEQGLLKLSARVGLVQQMDVVLGRLAKKIPQGAPSSRIDEIEAALQEANVLLVKTQPSEKDFQNAQAAISDASSKVDTLNQADDVFGQKLAQRIVDVKTDISSNVEKSPTFSRINGALPGPYATLKAVVVNVIPSDFYTSLEMATEKVLLMREYVLLTDGTKDKARLDRLQKKEEELLGFLQLESWEALRSARLIVREMRDDIYADQLTQMVQANPVEASIDMDPDVAYDRSPLEFCVCFNNSAVNNAGAREEWSCDWDFGDGLKAKGWNVSHYYEVPKQLTLHAKQPLTRMVSVSFRDANGKQITYSQTNDPVLLTKEVPVLPSGSGRLLEERTWTEGLILVVALLIAVFALVAGAREQLLKLDILPGLIAVFLMGFGADTVKNLLTSKA